MNKRIIVAVLGIVLFLVGLVFYYVASMFVGARGMAAAGFVVYGLLFTIGGLIILVLALVKKILFQVILIVLILVPHVLWIYGPVNAVSTNKEIYSIGETIEIDYSIFYVNAIPISIHVPKGFMIYYDTKPNSTEEFMKYMAVWSEGGGSSYLGLVFYANTHAKFVWNQTCGISSSETRYQAPPGHYYVWIWGSERSFVIQ
jgi:hypothetical protein